MFLFNTITRAKGTRYCIVCLGFTKPPVMQGGMVFTLVVRLLFSRRSNTWTYKHEKLKSVHKECFQYVLGRCV